ncbi:FFLEELY motif protein [Psychrobacter sp. 2Y5]|uniref:FFLEELY motif protein n=1 Tax=unclassified Psychrobacter TaxID=196806 RepID=UPI003F47E758
MSALSELQHHLARFWQLPYHDDAALNEKLIEVQAWQRARIEQTHADVFEQPKNRPMADYFLTQLYGGDEFKKLAEQLQRIVPKAKKVERFAPAAALETGSMAIYAAILAIELDLHLAQWLIAQDLPVNAETMICAYRAVDEADERRAQLGNLKEVCYRTDKYINSFMLRKAFAMAKGTAYRHNYQPLYDFIDAGFTAMRPLKSVKGFIEPFCTRELTIVDQVHAADNGDTVTVFAVS